MSDSGQRAWLGWIAGAGLVLLSTAFSFLNYGERVTLRLGVLSLYRVSLVGLVFVAFLLGMVTMFLFGLRHDRRVRDALRGRPARRVPPPPPAQPLDPPV